MVNSARPVRLKLSQSILGVGMFQPRHKRRVPRSAVVATAAVSLLAAPAIGIAAEQDADDRCPTTGVQMLDQLLRLGCESHQPLAIGATPAPGEVREHSAAPATPTPTDPPANISVEQRFVEIYDELDLPGTEPIEEQPSITGNPAADERIRVIAEGRGYKLRNTATAPLVTLEDEELQLGAAYAWLVLRHDALEAGHELELVSAHRDIDTQQATFLSHLTRRGIETQGAPFTAEQLASGEVDHVLDEILATSSIPGYSKHHDGYTIDIKTRGDGVEMTEFGTTEAFEWLSADNYAVARSHGFLPSYPHGADDLGPDPEEWELVWVGIEPLRGIMGA